MSTLLLLLGLNGIFVVSGFEDEDAAKISPSLFDVVVVIRMKVLTTAVSLGGGKIEDDDRCWVNVVKELVDEGAPPGSTANH